MRIKNNFKHTLLASYIAYVTQAIVNNFVPLLFLTFKSTYQISLSKITLLVTINFAIQLAVDLLSVKFVDKIGYRAAAVLAHLLAGTGLACLAFLPDLLPDPYWGLLLSIFLYALGGGLLEVLVSPIVEACPTEKKSASMSLLHSFYCWGHMFVVLFSTGFFFLAGLGSWRVLALIWAAVPFLNAVYFSQVPINALTEEGEGMPVRKLLSLKVFWIFFLLMLCAGSAEQGMSQWASAFAESGLGVSKAVGDLAGPCLFAGMMGLSRILYTRFSARVNLTTFMILSGSLCIVSYLLASLAPNPVLGLLGCALCGLSVGILWPGVFSLASAQCPKGGTALFALLALAGDLGCSGGPTVVGMVSEAAGGNLKAGLLSAIVFPTVLLLALALHKRHVNKTAI